MAVIPRPDPRALIRVTAVDDSAALRRFVDVPSRVFESDPAWVRPLALERRAHLSPRSNPYFRHARWQAWIAWRGDEPVGRISAQIDALHLERYADATGFFGMLDAEDREETFAALVGTAERWLRDRGMQRVRGPFSLSINDEMGLLVDGFDTPPPFMLGHARPYYAVRVEQLGYRKAVDALAYVVPPDFEAPPVMRRLVAAAGHRIRVRPLDRRRFDADISVMRDIFNDAWSENWGFVPFTEAEFRELGRTLRFVIGDDLVQIAEVDGEPAAFIVAIPDINEAIRDLGGRLFPTGWAKLLWRVKVAHPRSARVPLMGVLRRFQRMRIGTTLAFAVIDACRVALQRRGVTSVDLSWILEGNAGMRSIIESIGGRAYKRYRVYERRLDEQ